MSEQKKYDLGKTIGKAATPFILIVLLHALQFVLLLKKINVPNDVLYSFALAALGTEAGLVNWLKNRNKKSVLDKIKSI